MNENRTTSPNSSFGESLCSQTPMRTYLCREDGMALPIVLIMITVVGVVLVALLALATTTASSSVVAKNTADRTYAAHGGIDAAMQQIRAGATLCSDGSTMPLKVNRRSVLVTCSPATNGFDLGVGGWAVYINPGATNPGFETSNGVQSDKVITGPIFNGGRWTDMKAVVGVDRGQALSSAIGCPDAQFATDITTTPISGFKACVGGPSPAPAINPPLPAAPNAMLPATIVTNPPSTVTGTGANACRVFEPGRYTTSTPFTQSPNMYFKSGVYLLDNVGEVNFGKTRIAVAGQPAPTDTPVLTGCSAEAPDKMGALFLLGGDSRITVDKGGQFEINAFISAATSTVPPVAVRTVLPADSGISWLAGKQSTLTTASDALSTSGNKTTLIVHGAVYSPMARVSVDPRGNSARNAFTAGLVVGRFVMTAPAAIGPDQLQIGSGGTAGYRRLSVRAEATDLVLCDACLPTNSPTSSGIRKIIAYATLVVSAQNDLGIESWRIGS